MHVMRGLQLLKAAHGSFKSEEVENDSAPTRREISSGKIIFVTLRMLTLRLKIGQAPFVLCIISRIRPKNQQSPKYKEGEKMDSAKVEMEITRWGYSVARATRTDRRTNCASTCRELSDSSELD